MGKAFTGGTSQVGTQELLSPEQRQAYSSLIGDVSPNLSGTFNKFLGPQSLQDQQAIFEQSYLKPAQQAFEQFTVPGIQANFADIDATSSSALNKAISQAAADLSTSVGGQFGGFLQNQNTQQLQALSQFLPFLTQQTSRPILQQQQGLGGASLGAVGQIGGGLLGGPAGLSLLNYLLKGG